MRRTLTAAALAVAAAMAAVPASAMAAETVYAIVDTNPDRLVRFSTDAPGTILSSVPISGQGPDNIVGLDFRPSTGELYAIGTNGGLTIRLFRLDPETGVATPLTPLGTALNPPPLPGAAAFGMDFNPVVDRVRSVTDTDHNVRLEPETGAATFDTAVVYSDPAAVETLGALAYTNNTPGATSTTAYAVDYALNSLARLGGEGGSPSPNGGELTTIGALGLNVGANTGFDIAASDGRAYLTSVVNSVSTLATINLATGAVSSSQTIGIPGGELTGAMALGVGGLQSFSTNLTFVKESDGKATLTVNRTAGVGAASVDYATGNGTAAAPADYTATSGAVTFAAGETSKTITIPIANDAANEQPEAFSVTLSNPRLGALGETTTAFVVVVDDDAPPPPPPPPPPPDKTAPTVVLGTVAGRILRAFNVPFSCSEACTASFELRPTSKDRKRYKVSTVVGRARATLKAQGKRNARIALTRLTRRRLKGVKRLSVTLRVTTTDRAGNRSIQNKKVTLRR